MGDNWTISVDLVFKSSVEMLLFDRVRHDDQEEVEIFGFLWLFELSTLGIFATDVGSVVVIDSVLEGLDTRLVAELNNISVINVNIEASLL